MLKSPDLEVGPTASIHKIFIKGWYLTHWENYQDLSSDHFELYNLFKMCLFYIMLLLLFFG